MRRPFLAILAVLVLSGACQTVAPKPAASTAASPKLDLRVNPLMDLHYWVRKLAAEGGELPAVAGLPEAVAATRQAGLSLGDVGRWGILVGAFTDASTVEDLARVADEVPETFTLRDGKAIPIRQNLANLATAYRSLEPSFLATVWPQHRQIAERAAATLRQQLLPRIDEVYADLTQHLGAPSPDRPVPVFLVAMAPFPGAFSMLSQGGPFSVVALEGEPDSQWVEIVVHELIHGLDAQAGERSVLGDLRSRLEKVPGASPRDVHDFVHTVMFVQAAGTVRRVLDPSHRDYGDGRGYYARVGRAAEVVVPAWRAYLDGKIDRETALEQIVAGFSQTGKAAGATLP